MTERITGAKAIVKTLERLDVDTVFGLPGGAILTTYNELNDNTKFNHILVRHEQGAGHAASGYAIATGKVGVAMVTSGPAATNVVTALADANMDSVPIVVITGQVAASLIGTDAFQEADIVGITLPVTKHSFLVTKPEDVPRVLTEAFHIASTGRPGAVLVDITKSAMVGELDFEFPVEMELKGYNLKDHPDHQCLSAALELIKDSKKPVIYAGGGCVRANAELELMQFVKLLNCPVVTTLQARGVIPDSSTFALGMVGMHGTIAAAGSLQEADLIIALGTRFSDRVTGRLSEFAQHAKFIQADVDASEIGKNREIDAPLYGDVKQTLRFLNSELENRVDQHEQAKKLQPWWGFINELREKYPLYLDEECAQESAGQGLGNLSPQAVIKRIGEVAKEHDEDAVFVAGVGQHQMWASQFLGFEKPHNWVQSAGLGTMGYAIPAGMGAKAGRPSSDVWVVDGDGCFQMTNQELATCRLAGLPIKVMLINNGTLGMPRQWQSLLYNNHYSQTDLHDGADGWSGEIVRGDGVEKGTREAKPVPDFMKLAEAYDCLAIRVTRPEEVDEALERAAAEKERPVVVEFQVAKNAKVFPMVPAGESNDEIMYTQNLRPLSKRAAKEVAR
ncbi:MAG: acetolactate synthase large subunit [Candidatus Ancillula sp.]|jgi:acetolactate synthase-1/2/3 large subunit|nr:acetolactate synthase large subunit [Candidatus Ancillula sp.]